MHLFLTGYMGVGKSTIGLQLSKLLHYTFIDLDHYIEQKEKKSITAIFAEKGEVYFRNKEVMYAEELLNAKGDFVIALGGGTLQNDTLTTQILYTGICIYLYKPWGELAHNLKKLTDRPLVQQKTAAELLEIFETREPQYEKSQLKVPINTTFSTQKLAQMLRLSTNR